MNLSKFVTQFGKTGLNENSIVMHFKCVNNTLESICNVTQSIVKMLTMFKNRQIMFRNALVTFATLTKC